MDDADLDALTPAQISELKRRVKDANDRTRFLLASAMGPRFILYYNVSSDCYGMNDPSYATLFKRRHAAESIRTHLGNSVRIVRCRVNKSGHLVLGSIPKLKAVWTRRQSGRRLTRS